jgi:DNA-binding XRE family transcriptional regulator
MARKSAVAGQVKVGQDPWRAELRQARIKARLSRPAAAEASGIGQTTWANVEVGFARGQEHRAYRTTPETLAKMAATVGLDPRALVTAAFGEEAADTIAYEAHKVELPGRTTVYIVTVEGAMSTEEVAEAVRLAMLQQDALRR